MTFELRMSKRDTPLPAQSISTTDCGAGEMRTTSATEISNQSASPFRFQCQTTAQCQRSLCTADSYASPPTATSCIAGVATQLDNLALDTHNSFPIPTHGFLSVFLHLRASNGLKLHRLLASAESVRSPQMARAIALATTMAVRLAMPHTTTA